MEAGDNSEWDLGLFGYKGGGEIFCVGGIDMWDFFFFFFLKYTKYFNTYTERGKNILKKTDNGVNPK